MLTLSVLMENTASSDEFACEHGLSFLLESADSVVLFDAGKSGDFLDNARRMGCDLAAVTEIVLSHGHYDHTGGLARALRHIREIKNNRNLPPLIAHPGVLARRRRPLDAPGGGKDIGISDAARQELAAWPVTFAATPLWLREDIVFLGEVPHARPELCALVGEVLGDGGYVKDALPDDSALVYVTSKGLIIVAGCSHSGVANIVAHAKAVTGAAVVRAVYGGLHCMSMNDKALAATIAALKEEHLEEIFACHCTGDALNDFPGQIRLAAGQRHSIE